MTYQELVDAAQAYADRYDLEVVENMPLFIIMSESRMNRVLKTRKQSTRIYTQTIDDQEYYSLPPDYAGMRDIQLDSVPPASSDHSVKTLAYLNPEQFNNIRSNPYTGQCYYTIIANQIQVFPLQASGQAFEIVYYQKVPPLTFINTTNWMSEDYPDIYVSGVVAEIELFVKNYEVAKIWGARLVAATEELSDSDITERWAGTPMTIKAC